MRRVLQSLVAVLLAVIMLFSLFGCSLPTPSKDTDKPTQSEKKEDTEPDKPTKSDGEEPEKPTKSDGEEPVEDDSIVLSSRSLALSYNDSAEITFAVENEEGDVVWTVSEEGIVTLEVSENTLTVSSAEVSGVVTLTASVEGTEHRATCTVTVVDQRIDVETVTLEPTDITLEIRDIYCLSASVSPEDATDKTVTWSSSDTSVVYVDREGVITTRKAGTATVFAKAGDVVATCTVTVNQSYIPVENVILSRSTLSLVVGASATLKATVSPSDATDPSVTWWSEDDAIATVEDGKVVAKKEGSVKIKCKTTDGEYTATCRVEVSSATISVTGVSVNHSSYSTTVGQQVALRATVIPKNASDARVTWSSSDEEVATVDENGLVTAVAEGTAKITAKTEDGQYTASCSLTVSDEFISIENIALMTSAKAFTKVGETYNLATLISPYNASDTSVTWSSDNTKVVKVSSSGTITSVGDGVAAVTVKTNDGGKTATCLVLVSTQKSYATDVTLAEKEETMTLGDTLQLTATASPAKAEQQLFWSSDDESVLLVSSDGLVRAVGEGTANITVATMPAGKTASCQITVIPSNTGVAGEFVYLHELLVGQKGGYIGATAYSWQSLNEDIVTVSGDGGFTAVGAGETWVVASLGDDTAKMKVIVYDIPSHFVVSSQSINVGCFVGEWFSLPFSLIYDTPTENPDRLIYSTDNPEICTVDASGLVWSHSAGTAHVTVDAYGYAEAPAVIFTVTVSEVPKLSVSGKKLTLGESLTSSFTKIGVPAEVKQRIVTDASGKETRMFDCYYHQNWENLTVLSFMNGKLCNVYSMADSLNYTYGETTLQLGSELEDSERYVYDDYEQTSDEEIMRSFFLQDDMAQTAFYQRVFTDVLNEYEKGSTFEDDEKMTVAAVQIATNEYYQAVDKTDDMTSDAYILYAVTNAWRVLNGLNALGFDEDASKVAYEHCEDMSQKGYFAHENLDGKMPKDRIVDAGVTQKGVGENLAMGQTTGFEAFFSLMNSSGHRDNLLDSRYVDVGVGASNELFGDSGKTRQMYAQEFLIR